MDWILFTLTLIIFLWFAVPPFLPKRLSGKALTFTFEKGQSVQVIAPEPILVSADSERPFKLTDGSGEYSSEHFSNIRHTFRRMLNSGSWVLTEGNFVNLTTSPIHSAQIVVREGVQSKIVGTLVGLVFSVIIFGISVAL